MKRTKARKIKQIHKGNISMPKREYLLEAQKICMIWNCLAPISMSFYTQYNPEAWCLACGMTGTYQIITKELVDFINHLIGNSSAIEINSGFGALGRALSIPMIDRKLHLDPRAKGYYDFHESLVNQLPRYPMDIIHTTANKAVRERQPDWVVGCWVTQKLQPGSKNGSMFGVTEEKILEVSNYVHCGNNGLDIHRDKRICKLPHVTIEADWIVDRSTWKNPSHLKIWSKEEINFDDFPTHLEFDIIH